MVGTELIILFEGKFAFLTQDIAIDVTKLDLHTPDVNFKKASFWTVRVVNYDPSQKKLSVSVINYNPGMAKFSYGRTCWLIN